MSKIVGLVGAMMLILVGCSQSESEGQSATDLSSGQLYTTETSRVDPAELERLVSLGYVDYATGTVEPARDSKYNRIAGDYIFYVSADSPSAQLALPNGEVLHTWQIPFDQIWPDGPNWQDEFSASLMPGTSHQGYWRRAYLQSDGSVLLIFENLGLARIDRDSKVIWKSRLRAHNDLELDEHGRSWVLTRKPRKISGLERTFEVMDNLITVLSPQGELIDETSLIDVLDGSILTRRDWRAWIDDPQDRPTDPLHANSIELIPENLTARSSLGGANVLVSIRNLNRVVAVDTDRGRVTFVGRGDFRAQHDVTLTADGTILLFDNLGAKTWSRVFEFELAPWNLIWSYTGESGSRFFSTFQSTASRLSDGTTLIVPSATGSAFIVTPEGEIAWRFSNPHRARSKKNRTASLWDLKVVSASELNREFRISIGAE